MQIANASKVRDKDGVWGTVVPGSPPLSSNAAQVVVQTENGQHILVPTDLLVSQPDGTYALPLPLAEVEHAGSEPRVLPAVALSRRHCASSLPRQISAILASAPALRLIHIKAEQHTISHPTKSWTHRRRGVPNDRPEMFCFRCSVIPWRRQPAASRVPCAWPRGSARTSSA